MTPLFYRASFVLAAFLVITACARGEKERPALSPERKQELYERFVLRHDFDRDGQVTCDDITLRRGSLFARIDANHDSSLVISEYRLAPFEDKSFVFYPFEKVDTDISSTITLKEFSTVPDSQFGRFDRDRNCTVSLEEAAEATRDQFEERRGETKNDERPGRGRPNRERRQP